MPTGFVSLVAAAVFAVPSPESSAFTACAWVRGENDAAGAGFVVDGGRRWLVTCRHVVADRDRVDVFFPWHRGGRLITDKSEYLGNRPTLRDLGLLVGGKVLRRHDGADLALVELDTLPAGISVVRFADQPARVGDPVRVIGHRADLDTLWNITTGPVRQVGRLADGYHWRGNKLAAGADVVVGQWPIEEGDSGGPVFDTRGKLVGMASALRRQTPTTAIAISASEIRRFLALTPPARNVPAAGIADPLTRATVWVRPTATDFYTAGVLIDRARGLILTSAKGSGTGDRVGVAFPLRDGDKWVGEREVYRDPVGLHLRGAWAAGYVVARGPARDLALIRIESVPEYARAVPLAESVPEPGSVVHTMSHPAGLEFAWVYAIGSVRQRGRVALIEGEKPPRVAVTVLQLPAQAGSPGGPILNERGELVGVLSARESAQQTGYAATTEEIARFLDIALTDRPVRGLDGILARAQAIPGRVASALALAFVLRAEEFQRSGATVAAQRDFQSAIAFDPACSRARLGLATASLKAGNPTAARAELDQAVEKGPFDRSVRLTRAVVAADQNDWRTARSDLIAIVDVFPGDSEARQKLVGVLLELGKDDEAATAVGDTLRVAPNRLPAVAADLLAQADCLAKRFPDSPSTPTTWLRRALVAASAATAGPAQKAELEAAVKQAAAATDDAARLAGLRMCLERLSQGAGKK